MRYDSPVALATIATIVGIISEASRQYEADDDMDSYWVCCGLLGRIAQETGYGAIPEDMRERVLSLMQASPPRL